MNLKKTISFNKIKNISIEDAIVKINDTNEIKKEFPVMTIQKIYLKTHKQNIYLIYFSLITLIVAIGIFYISLKFALGIAFLITIFMLIAKFSLNKNKYFLYIKLNDNNTFYSIQFNTKKKEEILNVIWEIKRIQFEDSVATN